jgi:transposase
MAVPDCPGCRERDARIAELEARTLALEGQVRDLTDKLKPPAPPKPHDPQPPAPPKKKTGRKPGGQPGHKGHKRALIPAERVDQFVPFIPTRCKCCQAPLSKTAGDKDPPPVVHQYVELPKMAAQVIEYQGHFRTCATCQTVTHQPIPPEFTKFSKGPRLTATLSYFAGCHGVSKRGVEEIATTLFEVPLSLGTVCNMEREVSEALAPAYQEAKDAMAEATVKHVDETGWKEAGRKRWMWVAATASVVVFLIHAHRNLKALKRLVGDGMKGILCSDRWKVYDWWPVIRRQVCWAHLKRNFEKKVEKGGKGARIATACLDVQRRVFELWHLFKEGKCTRAEMDERAIPLSMELNEYLRIGARGRDKKFSRFCKRILKVSPSLWTFVVEEGVEPTNNHAERVLRRAVLWRRKSFGCHSPAGCRFVERTLTTIQSLRLEKRPILEFIVESVQAHRDGTKPPQLVLAA